MNDGVQSSRTAMIGLLCRGFRYNDVAELHLLAGLVRYD